jgi:hypothetical protein
LSHRGSGPLFNVCEFAVHDIYDPPPALTETFVPPKSERLVFTKGDLALLVGLCALLFAGSVLAWQSEPEVALATAAAGSLVILESWFTALGFLHRAAPLRLKARWVIFMAALVPWLLGLGVAVGVMLSLFWVFDRVG